MKSVKDLRDWRIKEFKKEITPNINRHREKETNNCIDSTNLCYNKHKEFSTHKTREDEILNKEKINILKQNDKFENYKAKSDLSGISLMNKTRKELESDREIIIRESLKALILKKEQIDILENVFKLIPAAITNSLRGILSSKDSRQLLETIETFAKAFIGAIPIYGFPISIADAIMQSINARIKKLEDIDSKLNFLDNYQFVCKSWVNAVDSYLHNLENYPFFDTDNF
ncbi:MAG: hypothetical protein K8R58_05995 [Bacteroidales bacterium]|nr:hypothetical protein [Bacteroidales bacterium]